MWAMVVKEFRELVRDHRTLAMLVIQPVILLLIFGYAANFSVDRVSVSVIGDKADVFVDELENYDTTNEDLEIVATDPQLTDGDAEQLLREQQADAVVVAHDTQDDSLLMERMQVYVDGSSLFPAQEAQGVFSRLAAEDVQNMIAEAQGDIDEAAAESEAFEEDLDRWSAELETYFEHTEDALVAGEQLPVPPDPIDEAEIPEIPELTDPELETDELVTVLFNPDLETSWVMIPGLIGLILAFIGMLITSIGLVREREAGTMEQLAVMPLKSSAIIFGKVIPYFLLAVIDMALITALGIWLFNVPFLGDIWFFSLTAIVFLFVVMGLGVLISSTSQTTGQAIQLAALIVIPQTLLSGLIFPLESMPVGIRWIGYMLPLTWFREIAEGIMLRGAGINLLWLPLIILAVMAVVAFTAAVVRMRKTLTGGDGR